MISEDRQKILNKIKEYEKKGLFDVDVEDDPETIPLLPEKSDYLGKKPFAKLKTFIANKIAVSYFEKQIKKGNYKMGQTVGLDNFDKVKGGAIITCNHFNAFDNYALYREIKPKLNGNLYKVIREGNYTNFNGIYGFFFKNCNTLPLSSNLNTMRLFLKAVSTLLGQGKKILIYPEQAMWYNYRKPRPLKSGAFNLAVTNNVPVIPTFITLKDTDKQDKDGLPVQEYSVHILEPIFPKQGLSKKENVEYMMQNNYSKWVNLYEKTYGKKLIYGED